ncbi:hypothetical protein SETIT_5G428500v2 [Setaria italica]|uniref:Ubiquitin-like domain-containing protein n=1 Tax=Setaria italica TaxID=4555 RepID=A0A368REX2_SETIT|nr:hypothetical protein SETIT_5G428500v2 [Setaria italica]
MSGNGEEDKKPAEGGAHINLKVKGQIRLDVAAFLHYRLDCFRFQCSDFSLPSFLCLLLLYYRMATRSFLFFLRSTLHNAIAFLFDGRRLRGEQTPDELEMEDGDEIDAMLHQTGGYVPSA